MLSTRFAVGAPVWADMCAPDLDTVSDFYRELFGWELLRGGPEVGGYSQFQLSGRTAAGAMAIAADEAPPAWTLYFRARTWTPRSGRSSRPEVGGSSSPRTSWTSAAWRASRT